MVLANSIPSLMYCNDFTVMILLFVNFAMFTLFIKVKNDLIIHLNSA